MSQPSQPFAYEQLCSMSFIQLFHLCVAITKQTWLLNLEEADERHQQPRFQAAADIHDNRGGALQRRWCSRGHRLRVRREAR